MKTTSFHSVEKFGDDLQAEQAGGKGALECTGPFVPIDAKTDPVIDELAPEPIDGLLVTQFELNRAPATKVTVARPTLSPKTAAPATPGFDDFELRQILLPPEQAGEMGRLGPYRVVSVLGCGGMGVVFQAEDPNLKRFVALKVMQPSLAANETARQRFLREARATAALANDHVVAIHHVGEDRGIPYFVMPLLEGETLDDYLQQMPGTPLNSGEIVRIAKEIADGLAAAHERGLIHRDIKPSNVWLEGEKRRVKIVDFGLARDRCSDVRLTQTGKIIGTPGYMSPEQVENKPIDPRSDLFSLGCLLYRLCTGQEAFRGETPFDTLRAVVQDEPAPIRAGHDLPADLVALVERLLAKKAGDRPANAAEVSKALQAIRKRLMNSTKQKRLPEAIPCEERTGNSLTPAARGLGSLVIIGGFTLGLAAASVWLATRPKSTAGFHVDEITIDRREPAVDSPEKPKESPEKEKPTNFPEKPKEMPEKPKESPEKPEPKFRPAMRVDQQWLAEKARLPARARMVAVVLKLKELNPGYDGDHTRTIDANNLVTRLVVSTDHVSVVWPIRALTDLQSLHLNGSAPGKGKLTNIAGLKGLKVRFLEIMSNPVADFLPLKELPNLETLRCDVDAATRNRGVLQSLAGLKRINEKPERQFWKEAK